ncbi:PilT-like protein [Beggiatoa sp. PS]|nr:PilT-like protein [Beggiatoa sp. PS]
MKPKYYLLDTHTIIFWALKTDLSRDFIQFLDNQDKLGHLLVSSISFWEIALLSKKGKVILNDIHAWKDELFKNTNLKLINPTVDEMIDATLLPDIHKDPFDRLLISQANHQGAWLVTKDSMIPQYDVQTFWM